MTKLTPGLVAYNVAYLVLAYGVALAAIALFWAYRTWYVFPIAFLLVSSRQQALLNCEHEAVHRKFLPNLRWNNFVGRYLCAAPVGSPFGTARARHLAHHRLVSTPEDPDRVLHDSRPPRDTPWGLVRYFANGLLGGYAVMVLFGPADDSSVPASDSVRRDLLSLVVSQGVIAAALTLLFAWWIYPALWLAPLASVTALCHLVRSFVEHSITESESAVHSNRLITIQSNTLERGLVAPYFMNYHAEHHLLPSVPAPRLRQLRRHLAGRSDVPPVLSRSSYSAAIRRYIRSLRAQ